MKHPHPGRKRHSNKDGQRQEHMGQVTQFRLIEIYPMYPFQSAKP